MRCTSWNAFEGDGREARLMGSKTHARIYKTECVLSDGIAYVGSACRNDNGQNDNEVHLTNINPSDEFYRVLWHHQVRFASQG